MPEVDAGRLKLVLEWMYTGKCELDYVRQLPSLLETAHFLQIASLQKAITCAMLERLDASTCLDAWTVARRYELADLERVAKATALDTIVEDVSVEVLLGVGRDQMCALLAEDELKADDEEALFELVVRWADAHPTHLEDANLHPVLKLLRFSHMRKPFLRERVARWPALETPEGVRVLCDGLLAESEHRHGCGPYRVYAFGIGAGGPPTQMVQYFDVAMHRWLPAAHMSSRMVARSGASVVSLGRKIYVIGGYSHPGRHGRGIDVYDSHDGQWRQISDGLRHRRTDSVAAAVAGRFYVIGGIDQASSDSVESYDPVTQTWARMDARMPTGRSALGVAVVHGLIFTIGGVCVDGQGIVLDSMEKYDPKSGVWTRLSSMPTARCAMGVAVLGGKIYVAGGRGAGYVALQVVEVFDPQEGTWTSLSRRWSSHVQAAGW